MQVEAGEDFVMPLEQGTKVVWHCPHFVTDVGGHSQKLASVDLLPPNTVLSYVLDHIP